MAEQTPDPVLPVVPPAATAPQAPDTLEQRDPSAEPTQYKSDGTDPYLTAILKQAAPEKAPKPAAAKAPEPIEPKPAGGLNDLAPDDIEDPQIRALGELFLSTAPNLDLNRALGKAIEYGDPNLIDTAYLKEATGDRANSLGVLATQIVEQVKNKSESTVKEIYSLAGDQNQWNAAVALFNKTAESHIKEVAVDLLNSHNHSKIKSGAKFILDYAKKSGGLVESGELFAGADAGAATAGNGMSREEFQAELRKIKPEHQNKNYAQEREALFQRRKAGKAQGR